MILVNSLTKIRKLNQILKEVLETLTSPSKRRKVTMVLEILSRKNPRMIQLMIVISETLESQKPNLVLEWAQQKKSQMVLKDLAILTNQRKKIRVQKNRTISVRLEKVLKLIKSQKVMRDLATLMSLTLSQINQKVGSVTSILKKTSMALVILTNRTIQVSKKLQNQANLPLT
jgi:hypothetical protein